MYCDLSIITQKLDDYEKRINYLEKRWEAVQKILKLAFVVILVLVVKYYM